MKKKGVISWPTKNFQLRKMSRTVIFLMLFHITCFVFSQGNYPVHDFRPPIDTRLYLSGTFGELRADHFHSGIDIKTGGTTGKPIYSIGDGYVSRIKISPFGFGKAIYVNHYNGYTSVYGHLDHFRDDISEFSRAEQYKNQSFDIDVPVKSGLLPVKKGAVIAWSGNTGSAAGPHLHFEIREEATQKPVNPLLFGLEVKDWIRPNILAIKIYPCDRKSIINGKNDTAVFYTQGWGPVYRLKNNDTIVLSGKFAFGIQAYDLQNDTDNKNGIYTLSVLIDSIPVFYIVLESFSFDETKYINTLIDYAEYINSGNRFIQSRIAPNNHLSIYRKVTDDGIFTFNDGNMHQIIVEVKDIAGNTSLLTYYLKSQEIKDLSNNFPAPESDIHPVFRWDRQNTFENENVRVNMAPGSLYEDVPFYFAEKGRLKGTFSPTYQINKPEFAVHTGFDLSIKADALPARLQDKAMLAKVNNGKLIPAGGYYKSGYVTGVVRLFGDYTVIADTIAPLVTPVNIPSSKDISSLKSIKMKISDESSGIKSFKGTINNEWILMEYDPKTSLLVYDFDDKIQKGVVDFKLEVADYKDNKSVYQSVLKY